MTLRLLAATLTLTLLSACAGPQRAMRENPMDAVAETYVKLVLALGRHDDHYVDAYYGPPGWRTEVEAVPRALDEIARQAHGARATLDAMAVPAGELERLRRAYLQHQLGALQAHAEQLQTRTLSFDAEARALYDIDPPPFDAARHAAQLARIDALLPGPGSLSERYNAYLARFAIPPERLDAVMRAAIDEARRRTAMHIELPPGETFELAFVEDKPWSAYNWYQGGYRSRIEINTDLPVTASRAIELAVHEGYPGHHVYNSLLEHALVRGRGWLEYTVYPLYSPQSLIAEGTADYAIALAFPPDARAAFLRETLFPLAGLDPAEAERYVEITTSANAAIGRATIEAARRYLDGIDDESAALARMQATALASKARAQQRLAFFRSYRAYIVNYALGESLVADYVHAQAGDDERRRWARFAALIRSPRLPSDLAMQVGS